MDSTTRIIGFDFADTIATLSPPRERIVQRYISSTTAIQVEECRIAEAYFYLQNQLFYSSISIQKESERQQFYVDFNKALFAHLGVSHLNVVPEELYQFFVKHTPHWTIKPSAIRAITHLHKKFKIAILSNFDSNLNAIIKASSIATYINHVHVSQSRKIEKPDVHFYQSFLDAYQTHSSNVLYIGDNYLLDYVPAVSIGIKTLLLDEKNRFLHLEKQRINNLEELTQLEL